ncbi:peptidylprolyl isomerase [Xanthomonas sontii]|uniref:Peptidylprolyl isomerase n=1 Tax=Xanthomonas sontii TaxID=2650745 RepID=A0A6N7QHB1_9XANT|nr:MULTISPECIES: peptidylprolyl isomerase [Xanthomonas]MCW0455435.1 Chaperone SurA [Xanthomonas sacchari]MRH01615.1 peptidylprolyl isomerase [Xanthomonas sontii]MRH75857.1 peptidylprolyl isomerase [Xanthomonas sontii]
MSLSFAKSAVARSITLATCALAAFAALAAPAAEPATADPVVLRVGAQQFTASEYRALAGDATRGAAGIDDDSVVRRFADRAILLDQARQQHLQDDPVVAARLRRAADAILADAAQARLSADARIDEAMLRRQFAAHPDDYTEYHLRHLFVALHPQGGPRSGHTLTEAQALQRAEALKRQLDGGADFATLAMRESDDTATAGEGGQLSPTFGRYLADAFDAPIRQLAVDQVSAPVRGPDGYHLIRLDAKTDARFEAVRGQIDLQLREQAAADAMQRLRQAQPMAFDRDAYTAAAH